MDSAPIDLRLLLLLMPLFLLTVSTHEFSHAWVASKLGDPTAKERGRLTLNPLAHLSWKLTVALPILVLVATQLRFIFLLAKPVPINPFRLRSYVRGWRCPFADMIWVGLVGPAVNLAIASLLALVVLSGVFPDTRIGQAVLHLVYLVILINLFLGMINLLPIPPLDGSRLIIGLLPHRYAIFILRYELVMLVAVISALALVAILAGGIDKIMLPPLKWAWSLLGLNPAALE